MSLVEKNATVTMVVVDLQTAAYPVSISGEIRRLLNHGFKWQITSTLEDGVLALHQWQEGDPAPDPMSVNSKPPASRKLVESLVHSLAHFAPAYMTVEEFVKSRENAACHKGLSSVYGCAECSRQINAVRALQLAKSEGLLD